MQNNAKVGGILSIIAGSIGVLWLIGMVFSIVMMSVFFADSRMEFYYRGDIPPDAVLTAMMAIYAVIGGFFTLVGVLGIIGGVFSLRKKNWGLALAGAIAGTLVFFPCGIPAIIFTAISKPEFEGQSTPAGQI
jgi:hypothetical protein